MPEASDPRDQRIAELERDNEGLRRQLVDLARRIKELEERLRRSKRQAAPFAREQVVEIRGRPGRSPGHVGVWQAVPEHVDEELFAPLCRCPECGGEVTHVEDLEQFVVDLPEVRPQVQKVVTQRGWCGRCRRKVRSTHPAQVSRAAGAARVSLGRRVLGLAAELKHRLGVPYRDIAAVFKSYFGLSVTHSALVHGSLRVARKGAATYRALVQLVRHSAVVQTDDTGWRIDARPAWLWVFATGQATVYVIAEGRGHQVVTDVLGRQFAGTLVSDGLPALDALDQLDYVRAQCLGHLLRRARELDETQSRGAVRFPRAVKLLLQQAILLAHRHDELSPATMREYTRRIERRTDRLLRAQLTQPENRKLAQHLRKHRLQLFGSLYDPEIPPTNNLSEQQLRSAVITRKIGGCNRSDRHAGAHAIIASLAQTAHRNGRTLAHFVHHAFRPRDGPPALEVLIPALRDSTSPQPRGRFTTRADRR